MTLFHLADVFWTPFIVVALSILHKELNSWAGVESSKVEPQATPKMAPEVGKKAKASTEDKQPKATKKPAATRKPKTTEKSTATRKPKATRKPAATSAKRKTKQQLTLSDLIQQEVEA